MRHSTKKSFGILLLLAMFLIFNNVTAQEPSAGGPPSEAKPELSAPVPELVDIVPLAAELTGRLADLEKKVANVQDVSEVEKEAEASSIPSLSAPDEEAMNPSTTETINNKVQNQAWEPPPPPPDEFDWIQLTSGEWLKGELKSLYERELEFDSDKLDLLEFDWEDVKQVRSTGVFSVRLAGPITVSGQLQITENKVIMTNGSKQQVFERDRLFAIAPKAEKRRDYWTGKISMGLNFSSGNTEQTQYNAKGNVERRTAETRLMANYLGNLIKSDHIETVNNHRIQGQFDIFKTRNYFFRPIFGEYYRDPLRNIKYSATLGCGMGYYLINTSKTEWEIAGGPAYQITRFNSVETGKDSSESTPALMAGTDFDTELTEDIDFNFKYTFQIVNQASGTYTHHSITTFETELTKWLDFDTSFVWDRVQDPTPDDDGTVPKLDDFYVIFSLGIDF